jgi:hypothetical protein
MSVCQRRSRMHLDRRRGSETTSFLKIIFINLPTMRKRRETSFKPKQIWWWKWTKRHLDYCRDSRISVGIRVSGGCGSFGEIGRLGTSCCDRDRRLRSFDTKSVSFIRLNQKKWLFEIEEFHNISQRQHEYVASKLEVFLSN